MVILILSWTAIIALSTGYWFQIWKIHIHKEVRDISLTYNILLAVGFGILAFTAYQEGSHIFLIKQIMTTIPVIVIVFQILYHKDDHWHDAKLKKCEKCSENLEDYWKYCVSCGHARPKKT